MIRPYLSDIINDHKVQDEWRIQLINDHKTRDKWKIELIIAIDFLSSKDSNETRTMHTKSDYIEIMMGSEADESLEDLLESLLQRYQGGSGESMGGSEFILDSVDRLYQVFIK